MKHHLSLSFEFDYQRTMETPDQNKLMHLILFRKYVSYFIIRKELISSNILI